jgi:hypothetical protein
MTYRSSRTDDTSRRVIDTAIGVLVGLRGCSPDDAFAELVQVVHQTRIGIGSVATGLVALASGAAVADHAEAFNAWGDLVRGGQRAAVAATAS